MNETLTERSPELAERLAGLVAWAMGRDSIAAYEMNTGGGCYVLCVDLSINLIDRSRQLWLTRDDSWYLGFYDFGQNEEDEGIVVQLQLHGERMDDPNAVAAEVAGIVRRMGIGLKDA